MRQFESVLQWSHLALIAALALLYYRPASFPYLVCTGLYFLYVAIMGVLAGLAAIEKQMLELFEENKDRINELELSGIYRERELEGWEPEKSDGGLAFSPFDRASLFSKGSDRR